MCVESRTRMSPIYIQTNYNNIFEYPFLLQIRRGEDMIQSALLNFHFHLYLVFMMTRCYIYRYKVCIYTYTDGYRLFFFKTGQVNTARTRL